MNNKVLSLTKVSLKNSSQMAGNKKAEIKGNSKSKKIKMFILYAIIVVYLAAIFGFLSFNMISGLILINQEKVFIGVLFLAIAMLLIIQSVFSAMNVLYFSKDLEFILPLPIKPRQILMAKFNVLLFTEYLTEFVFALLPLAIYGIMTGAGPLYYILATLTLFVFPILPLVISTFVVMIVMSFAKFTKSKDKFQVIVTILIIAVSFWLQFSLNGNSNLSEEQVINQIVKVNGLVEVIENYFITLRPTINALTSSVTAESLVGFGQIVLITVLAYATFILIGDKIYFRGALNTRTGGKTKQKNIDVSRAYKSSKIGVTYVLKEMKTLIKNPIFFTQCILPSLLMPILFIVLSIKGVNSSMEGSEDLIKQALTWVSPTILTLIIVAITQFFTMMQYISATAISRDGLNAVFMKYIPLSLYRQYKYKATPSIIMNTISILIICIILNVSLGIHILMLIPAVIIAMLLNVFQSYLMILPDLKKPKLEWDTEYEVVKQNMNLIWPMIYGFVMIGIIAVFGVIFTILNIDIRIAVSILIILSAIAIFVLDRYVYKSQDKLFEKII